MLIRVKKRTDNWQQRKDILHRRRMELVESLRRGIFTHGQMMQRDCHSEAEENERVLNYCQWKTAKDKEIEELHKINEEFKKNGEEGKPFTLDNIRNNKVKFE